MDLAAYLRYSEHRQKDTSLEDQLRVIQEWAARHGHTIVAEFADAALTGATAAPRPGLQDLLAEIASPDCRFKGVVVHQLSRLSRNVGDTWDIIFRQLQFHNIRLMAVADGIDTADRNAKMQVVFKSMQNELFLDDQRANVKRGMDGQFMRGLSTGSLPFGYCSKPIYRPGADNDPRAVEGYKVMVDPKQAETVRDIFRRYLAGEGYRTIARALNASTGDQFSATRIQGILTNPMYFGRRLFNQHEHLKHPKTGKTIFRLREKTEWLHRYDRSLAIVGKKTWKQVHNLMTRRKGLFKDRQPAAKHLLTGLLFCEQCNGRIAIVQHRSYGCARAYLNDPQCNNTALIHLESLEQVVIEAVANHLPGHLDMLIESVRHRIATSAQDSLGIQKRIESLDAKATRLLASIQEAQFTGRAKQTAQAQFQLLNDEIEALERTKGTGAGVPVTVSYDRQVLKAFIADLPKALTSDRQAGAELLAHLIKRVTVQSGHPMRRTCPLCQTTHQKVGPPHARKHHLEMSQFLRRFPWMGCTNEMRLTVTFNAQGLFKKEKIVGLQVSGSLTIHTDDFLPAQIAIVSPKAAPCMPAVSSHDCD